MQFLLKSIDFGFEAIDSRVNVLIEIVELCLEMSAGILRDFRHVAIGTASGSRSGAISRQTLVIILLMGVTVKFNLGVYELGLTSMAASIHDLQGVEWVLIGEQIFIGLARLMLKGVFDHIGTEVSGVFELEA